jgi:hypothetical protein
MILFFRVVFKHRLFPHCQPRSQAVLQSETSGESHLGLPNDAQELQVLGGWAMRITGRVDA